MRGPVTGQTDIRALICSSAHLSTCHPAGRSGEGVVNVVVEVADSAATLSRNADEWVRSGDANRIHNAYRTWHPHPLADYLGECASSSPTPACMCGWRGEKFTN
jgi:hypothetical protein